METIKFPKGKALQNGFWIMLVLNLVFMYGASAWLQPLNSRDIVKLEIAREISVAADLLSSWKMVPGKMEKAEASVYIDFIFILLYIPGLAIACRYLSRLTNHEILLRAGIFFSYLLIGVFISEIIENLALLKVIQGDITLFNVRLVYNMAVAKFSILILIAIFLIVNIPLAIISKFHRQDVPAER